MNILSLTFNRDEIINLFEIFTKLKKIKETEKNIDLVVFPEYWNKKEIYNDFLIDQIKKYVISLGSFVAIPVYFLEKDKIYNRLMVISPNGENVYQYDKINLYYKEENIEPGTLKQKLYWDILGMRISFAICFDINFTKLWSKINKNNVDLVIWVSSYHGGKKLGSYAGIYHYYVLSSTMQNSSVLYDITGEKYSEKTNTYNIFHIPSRKIRDIYHYNKNIDIIQRLENKILIEKKMDNEQWLILVKKNNYDLKMLENNYSLINLRDYIKYGISGKNNLKKS